MGGVGRRGRRGGARGSELESLAKFLCGAATFCSTRELHSHCKELFPVKWYFVRELGLARFLSNTVFLRHLLGIFKLHDLH